MNPSQGTWYYSPNFFKHAYFYFGHLLEEDLPDPSDGFDEDDAVGAAPTGEQVDDDRQSGCEGGVNSIGHSNV